MTITRHLALEIHFNIVDISELTKCRVFVFPYLVVMYCRL